MTTTTHHVSPYDADHADDDQAALDALAALDDEPAPFDPLAALTITELDAGSRQLKTSLVAAITQQSAGYERALAIVLWLHRRRADPAAKLQPLLGLTFVELQQQLTALGELQGPTTPGS